MISEPRAVAEGGVPTFLPIAREHLRSPGRGHPLAYIIRELRAAYAELVAELDLPVGSRVVDYGCAALPYRDLFGDRVTYVGADLPGNADAAIEIRPDGTLPIAANDIDAVVSS